MEARPRNKWNLEDEVEEGGWVGNKKNKSWGEVAEMQKTQETQDIQEMKDSKMGGTS